LQKDGNKEIEEIDEKGKLDLEESNMDLIQKHI